MNEIRSLSRLRNSAWAGAVNFLVVVLHRSAPHICKLSQSPTEPAMGEYIGGPCLLMALCRAEAEDSTSRAQSKRRFSGIRWNLTTSHVHASPRLSLAANGP